MSKISKYHKYFIVVSFLFSYTTFLVLSYSAKIVDEYSFTNVTDLGRNDSGYIRDNQYAIDVLHYNMNLELNHAAKLLKANVTITIHLLEKDLKSIELNFYDNLKISSLKVNEIETQFNHSGKQLSIKKMEYFLDTVMISISYEGTPKKVGLSGFVFGTINNQSLVYTINEPEYASSWFPCNDIPTDKAFLDIRITNDKDKISISNGKLIEVNETSSTKSFYYKTFYPISTYLISVYSSNYTLLNDKYISVSGDTLPLNYYVLPGQEENAKIDFEEHSEMLKFLSSTFGEYPFMNEKYGIAVFLWQMGAMENQTITGIGSNFITGKKFFNDMLLHELAHSWWGNSVGVKSWKDIWLNEGFSTYSEVLYNEWKFGASARISDIQKIKNHYSGTVYNPNELFSGLVYNKGAWILHMLRKEIGDSTFFPLMKIYYNLYKYSSTSTEDFIKTAEKVSGKNLSAFFNQWLFSDQGELLIDYNWSVEKKNDEFELKLFVSQQTLEKEYQFPLDVEFHFDDKSNNRIEEIYIDKKEQSFIFKLKNKPVNVILDPENWLLATITYISKTKY
ncbi:MAG: M1 family metallopeptidase [Ignavibacteria bacterium]|nr:M1 family metallopeptidase [Ignavibacteria bacterium]